MHFLRSLFDSADLAPHGICLLWRPELVWLHVISDALIGISYFSIPVAIGYFAAKRSDIVYGWVFWAFAIFIWACGSTHFFSIWTLWSPNYGAEGLVKVVTAGASVVTAVALWPLLPKALALPSNEQLRRVNDALKEQIKERDAAMAALEAEKTERLKAEEMLRQTQKMDAIGQLTGGIAHDFNNMLTVILGNVEGLAESVAGAPKLVTTVRLIEEAAERGAELTQHLLAFARKQPLEPCPTDVNALVTSAETLFKHALGEQIEIETILEDGALIVLVDPSQLRASLLNLAVNARDAMPNGGKLTIETANVVLDETYAASNSELSPGRYGMIAVSDTGVGIPAPIRDRVFEPFFTTKEMGKGTGLGLSMVYGFVKQSNGHIKLYSEEGHGTTIKIYLPRSDEQAVEIADEVSAVRARGGSETILVVEDDALVLEYVSAQLEGLGYTTLLAANAAEALAIIERGEKIDLLFTDVILTGTMNGRELAREVTARVPSIKVLFTSGYTENSIVHHGRLDSGVLLLTKPYRNWDLANMVRMALRT
ncbi:MAG: response regulator [Methylobacteriaceae bacterium]|nr:response regulator [Methylobacteriaceae bacterium]